MAMTKAEQARVLALETELRMARALRWPIDAEPKMMTKEEIRQAAGPGLDLVTGWFMNAYSVRVTLGCSNGIHHNSEGTDRTSTQTAGAMYRTEIEAWRALRHVKVREVAKTLARIDAEIERAEAAIKTERA